MGELDAGRQFASSDIFYCISHLLRFGWGDL
jgi:hypothetical protein